MSRNRDLYMRKHHSPAAARAVRWLTAWTYALRALAALVLPGHSPRRYWRHVTATLHPERGEGLREAAAEYNRRAALRETRGVRVDCGVSVPAREGGLCLRELLRKRLDGAGVELRARDARELHERLHRRCVPDGRGDR